MTIQSSSPRSRLESSGSSVLRCVPMDASCDELIRRDGRCGGSSRMTRWISAMPADSRALGSNGVEPVRSS